MYYKVINNNKDKWILLLHCICSNMHIFDSYIDKLSKEYNILLIDLPGHGKSKEYNDKISFKEVSLKIVNILDKLEINKISIWGISLGSVIAKYLLKIIPNRIDKIVFEGAALYMDSKLNLFMFRVFNKVKWLLPKVIYLRAFIFTVLYGKQRKDIRKMMYSHLKQTNYEIISRWLTVLCGEYNKVDFNILNESKIDKTYIFGDKDYIFKNGTINNIVENEYNKIIIKEKCGHLCHLETQICL